MFVLQFTLGISLEKCDNPPEQNLFGLKILSLTRLEAIEIIL